jgi:hypothetical protein
MHRLSKWVGLNNFIVISRCLIESYMHFSLPILKLFQKSLNFVDRDSSILLNSVATISINCNSVTLGL